jgi:hypothetical protein
MTNHTDTLQILRADLITSGLSEADADEVVDAHRIFLDIEAEYELADLDF